MEKCSGRRKVWKISCLMLSVTLLLAGCGQADTPKESGENRGEQQTTVLGEAAALPEPEKEEEAEEEQDVEDRLFSLALHGVFERSTTNDADLKDEDTKEVILQKLSQCEEMGLYVSNEDSLYILEHLYFMPNLKRLWLTIRAEEYRLEDFDYIAEFSRLEDLSIYYDTETEIDFSFLAKMPTITKLTLWGCRIEDSAFLGQMPQLESLTLYDTSIDDLAILERMSELTELTFAGYTAVKNPEVVGKMSRLQELDLWECGLTDISFLSGLEEMRSIDLGNNSIADLSPLAGMTKLERLWAERNRISDLSPLAGLPNLYDLSLTENEIADISALEELSHLNQVVLTNNRITDLTPLAEKEELIRLNVYGNPCRDLRPVWNVPSLIYGDGEVTKEEAETADQWMKEKHPEIEEYRYIDYAEGDLNQDGRMDIAFVVDEIQRPSRQLFVLLQQEDGFWREIAAVPLTAVGKSGQEPYCNIFLGGGYLMQQDLWSNDEIYLYEDGKLELARGVWIEGTLPDVWHVTEKDMINDTCLKYDVVLDGQRMVRTKMRYEQIE